jgi:CO/xanthine dehydrogenase Mo-binding subunit
VGRSVQRIDATLKVQGRAPYAKDIEFPHMLYAKIKRSPHSYARIVEIDVSKAISTRGVRAVITGNDFPDPQNEDTPPLAKHHVWYHKQGVAAVAADTPDIANEALEALTVTYHESPPLLDPLESLSPSTNQNVVLFHPKGDLKQPNIGKHLRFSRGDLDSAFEASHFVLQEKYTTSAETHFQLEPLTFVARPDPDGGITIWGTTSGPTKLKFEVARYLKLSPGKVRAIVPFLGGWFGSKEENHLAAVCTMLALRARRPVKLELTREETIFASGVRHPSVISIKDGITKEGLINVREIRAIFDGGAYGLLGNVMVKNAFLTATSVYKIPNFSFEGFRAYTNRVPGSAKRAPFGTQMTWAIECQMDRLASELRIDSVRFRLQNALRESDLNSLGEPMIGTSHHQALELASKEIQFEKKQLSLLESPWKHGRGVALSSKWTFTAPNQAMIRVHPDSTIDVFAPVVENGQGIYTGIAQIVSEEFKVPLENVNFFALNTGADSSWGFGPGARSSQQLVNMGKAVVSASRQAKEKIARIAAPILKTSPEDIDFAAGRVFSLSKPDKSVGFEELFLKRSMFGIQVLSPPIEIGDFAGYGIESKKTGEIDAETGEVKGGRASVYYVSVAEGVDLWVNVETGKVRVEKVAAVIDAGKAINPALIRGQIEGSIMMGLSAALAEELIFIRGRLQNASLSDYKVLTSMEAPEISTTILETAYADGPYGAKGVGEAATMPIAAALQNAIHDACGVWINDLPLTRERILFAIKAHEADG